MHLHSIIVRYLMDQFRSGFRATLNFRKFKVALNPYRRILVASYYADYNSIIKKWGSPSSFSRYKHLRLKLRVFSAGHIVAMVLFIHYSVALNASCSADNNYFMKKTRSATDYSSFKPKTHITQIHSSF